MDDRTMPMGAIISPPNSASSGNDDEEQEPQIEGRKFDKALRDAVSQIPMPRSSSPERSQPERQDSGEHVQLRRKDGVHLSFSTSALGGLATGRKIGHVQSAAEPNAGWTKSADNSASVSEDGTDEVLLKKPRMVRKKSGELVLPSLRPSSQRHTSSMPGTPVFSKVVHFDSHLEHVRHFLQVDRPLAVSAGSSPTDSYESDTEYPFPGDRKQTVRTPPLEWEILTTNFPHNSATCKSTPVQLEKVWLSSDQESLLGSVAVANIAFHKAVTCRFTLDYWETISEVAAEYSHEIFPRETLLGHDRFIFSIKLADTANLESKTLFLCVRYTVYGQDYWDNNNSSNFQAHFRKKHLSQNVESNFQGASSGPANGLRLKSKPDGSLASDNLSKDFGSPSGLAFSNRYYFGTSFNAAVQAAKDKETSPQDKDGLYLKANVWNSKPTLTVPEPTNDSKSQTTSLGATSPNLAMSRSIYEELVNKYCFFGSKQSIPNIKDGTLNGARFEGSVSSNPIHHTHITSLGSPNGYSHHARPAARHTHHLHGCFSPPSAASTPKDDFCPSSISPIPRPSATVRSASPAFMTFDDTPSNDLSYHDQQQMIYQFSWAGDGYTATVIRG